jgi:Leucine-rich repeat (LRR) protein
LQHLNASGCDSLEELPPNDFISLTQLEYLDVSECKKLKNLNGIGEATALQRLYASGCDSLEEPLPNDLIGLT